MENRKGTHMCAESYICGPMPQNRPVPPPVVLGDGIFHDRARGERVTELHLRIPPDVYQYYAFGGHWDTDKDRRQRFVCDLVWNRVAACAVDEPYATRIAEFCELDYEPYV
jgi:hypothetical protein